MYRYTMYYSRYILVCRGKKCETCANGDISWKDLVIYIWQLDKTIVLLRLYDGANGIFFFKPTKRNLDECTSEEPMEWAKKNEFIKRKKYKAILPFCVISQFHEFSY